MTSSVLTDAERRRLMRQSQAAGAVGLLLLLMWKPRALEVTPRQAMRYAVGGFAFNVLTAAFVRRGDARWPPEDRRRAAQPW